jgi:hypothetical protein
MLHKLVAQRKAGVQILLSQEIVAIGGDAAEIEVADCQRRALRAVEHRALLCE